MQRVLTFVDHILELVLGLLDDLSDLVLRILNLRLGLASTTISLTFGLKVRVAGNDSSNLLAFTFQLIRLRANRTPTLTRHET